MDNVSKLVAAVLFAGSFAYGNEPSGREVLRNGSSLENLNTVFDGTSSGPSRVKPSLSVTGMSKSPLQAQPMQSQSSVKPAPGPSSLSGFTARRSSLGNGPDVSAIVVFGGGIATALLATLAFMALGPLGLVIFTFGTLIAMSLFAVLHLGMR